MSLEDYHNLPKKEKSKGRNRYGNRKKEDRPTLDGFIFASDAEYYRYIDLRDQQKHGKIKDLKVKTIFHLAEKKINIHGQKISKWEYESDFDYILVKNGAYCVEDVKSLRIDENRNKFGTATERSYILTRNELMRQRPNINFVETIY